MKYSKYQQAIFEHLQNSQQSLLIAALAGSGKTSTIVHALNYIHKSERVLFCAFNKHIAEELEGRVPFHVDVKTLHSLGYSNIRRSFPKVKLNKEKNSEILDTFFTNPRNIHDKTEKKNAIADRKIVERLVSLAKATLSEPSIGLAEYYGDVAFERHVEAAKRCLEEATNVGKYGVDFDDMIYLCAIDFVTCEPFTTIMVDESQDLNESQIAMLLKSRRSPDSRVVAVGDSHQSIYGFRGASSDAIKILGEQTGAVTLPLSICYRCAKHIVEQAQKFVPAIEWWEDSPQGVVADVNHKQMLDILRPGDYVVCRINAPLFSVALKLIERNKKPQIRGKDLGKHLAELADRLSKNETYDEFVDAVLRWRDTQIQRADSQSKCVEIDDCANVLILCARAAGSPAKTRKFIDNLFADKYDPVVLSSIHKAKGLEAERVFWIKYGLKTERLLDWEIQVETVNIPYVAVTRAKRELYYVTLPKGDENGY